MKQGRDRCNLFNSLINQPKTCFVEKPAMGKCATIVFVLVVVGNFRSCSSTNDLQGCECNIMNACDEHGKPEPTSAHYLPAGLEKFGYAVQLSLKLGISV